jgi:hypothetical protein
MQFTSTIVLLLVGCPAVTGFNFRSKVVAPVTSQTSKVSIPSYVVPILGSVIGLFLSPNLAEAATELKTYSNERYHTVLSYPADFEMKTGQISGDRDVIAFTDPTDPDTSASLVFSPVPAGYLNNNTLLAFMQLLPCLINLFSATEVNMFHYFLCNRESLS